MTKDDILRMAREAGFSICQGMFGEMLEDFANRVAAHEREALTDVIIDKVIEKVLKKMVVEESYE